MKRGAAGCPEAQRMKETRNDKTIAQAVILSQEQIAAGIYSMWLKEEKIASGARPGQFVNVYSADRSHLLPRPISICETDAERGALRLVYRVAGAGTEEFSKRCAGESLKIIGPLGNGFPLSQNVSSGREPVSLLFGGGIGIPPMVELAKRLPGRKIVIAGYRDELFLTQELSGNAELYIATEDGSAGTKGNVLDAVTQNHLTGDYAFACGPTPMLRALKEWAEKEGVPCWLSLEERMACGVGACLACVCRTRETDAHSGVHNARICADGPVFAAEDIVL